ncbi:TauD/TfdA family dioxygenase [Actinosynnema sp. NPDC023794]
MAEDSSSFVLDLAERAELDAIAELVGAGPSRLLDDPRFVDLARDLSCRLPERLSGRLRRFRHDAGPDGMLLLGNLPVRPDELPDTPRVAESAQRDVTVPAAALVLIALQLGEAVAFRQEKGGALVQDVVPVPGREEFQGNAGSVALTMHVENAFHDHRPDHVALLCLRNDHDDVAGLKIASVRRALPLLSTPDRSVLAAPRFVTEPPGSFGGVRHAPVPHPVLGGAHDDPDIRVDFLSTRPLDEAAERAMARLGAALAEVCETVVLAPGDLAIVDNRLALHGRTPFTPRYDGRDRWLQRVFVHLDHRRSRALRPGNGQVLEAVGTDLGGARG